MANFCPTCGRPVDDGDVFCTACGARLAQAAPVQQPQPQQVQYVQQPVQQPMQYAPQRAQQGYAQPQYAQPINQGQVFAAQPQVQYVQQPVYVQQGVPAPGWSARINDPAIQAAMKKQRGCAKVFALIMVPIPIIGFLVYSFVTGDMDPGNALKYGAIVSAIFLIFAIFSLIKGKAEKGYEATVVDKQKRRVRQGDSDDGYWMTEYTLVVRTTEGKQKKIVENERVPVRAWDYLEVGDVFRYHPGFAFPYERYDKSRVQYLYCVGCQAKNPVTADRCGRCGLPLLK